MAFWKTSPPSLPIQRTASIFNPATVRMKASLKTGTPATQRRPRRTRLPTPVRPAMWRTLLLDCGNIAAVFKAVIIHAHTPKTSENTWTRSSTEGTAPLVHTRAPTRAAYRGSHGPATCSDMPEKSVLTGAHQSNQVHRDEFTTTLSSTSLDAILLVHHCRLQSALFTASLVRQTSWAVLGSDDGGFCLSTLLSCPFVFLFCYEFLLSLGLNFAHTGFLEYGQTTILQRGATHGPKLVA